MENSLEQLRKLTTIVADTGNINQIKNYKPTDATTNPSLILAAANIPEYGELIKKAIDYGKQRGEFYTLPKLFVNFGCEILNIIPGRISTEVDARYSFDVKKSIEAAEQYIYLYHEAGIERERVLIKLASTWEGIQAARYLEAKGIHCNMTLLFNIVQAAGCGEAKARLISPFVGRILDWHKKKENKNYLPHEDPGVLSVKSIYNYYKKFGYKTEIMGASFRNSGEIIELAGCDLLTIAPSLLDELQKKEDFIERKLSAENAKKQEIEYIKINEQTFRYLLNEDAMATEKLAEGIRNFVKDTISLEKLVDSFRNK